jgi:hypothetical protein
MTTVPARFGTLAVQTVEPLGAKLRRLYEEGRAARAELAALTPAERAARLLAERDRVAAEARAELHTRQRADRWRLWCEQVVGDLDLYLDRRADPAEVAEGPAAMWLTTPYLDRRYADRIAAWLGSDSRTLVLYGGTGRGKTGAAVAAGYAAAADGEHVRFVSQLDYLLALRPGGTDDPGAFRDRYVATGLLIFDDLGAETEEATQFVRQEVCALLDARLRSDRRQIVTTNHLPKALAESFGDRIVSRLRDGAVVLHIEGDDRRNLARAPW